MNYAYRVVCSGRGRVHALHKYERETEELAVWTRDYLERQKWSESCRPMVVERREIGEWEAA